MDKIFCSCCDGSSVNFIKCRSGVNIYRCNSCFIDFAKFNSSNVIPTDPDFYHGIVLNFDEQVAIAREKLPGRLDAYAQMLSRPIRSVVEVGCATGAYAPIFAELGIAYTGIEIDAEIAKQAQQRTKANIISGDFLDVSFDTPIDLFFCSQVLEHVPEPKAFIEHAKKVAANGIIHVDVPNHAGLISNIRKLVSKTQYGFIQPPYHMIAYNQKALGDLFTRCGLSEIHCRPLRNDDPIWGQLVVGASLAQRVAYSVSDVFSGGSLLTGTALATA